MVNAKTMDLPPEKVETGRRGRVRKIEFRKLMMDKDYVWKLEFIVKSWRIPEIEMKYDASLIADPTHANDQLANLYKEANSKQMSMEHITGKLANSMAGVHARYEEECSLFGGILDFAAGTLKMENKPMQQQLIILVIGNEAAQNISKLKEKLDNVAIVLRGSSDGLEDEDDDE